MLDIASVQFILCNVWDAPNIAKGSVEQYGFVEPMSIACVDYLCISADK